MEAQILTTVAAPAAPATLTAPCVELMLPSAASVHVVVASGHAVASSPIRFPAPVAPTPTTLAPTVHAPAPIATALAAPAPTALFAQMVLIGRRKTSRPWKACSICWRC